MNWKSLTKHISYMANRSIDWLIVISYALHNIFFVLAINANTSQVAIYIKNEYGISPLWIILLLMLGLIWSACLWLRWQVRLLGWIPLAIVALTSIGIYVALGNTRAILTVAWVYFMVLVIPSALAAVQGNLQDSHKRENILLHRTVELERLTKAQEMHLIEMEHNFATGKISGTK